MLSPRPMLKRCLQALRLVALAAALLGTTALAARSLHKSGAQLANNAVLCMYQDQQGDMWIGTYDGLHLYNGKSTFVYRMELDNENSLCSNIVLKITSAEKGYLWVSTSLGVNKFSLRDHRVVESYMQYVDVKNIVSDSAGNAICFANEDFISCYHPDRAFFEDVYVPGTKAGDIAAVWAEGVGLFCAVTDGGELIRYRFDASKTPALTIASRRTFSAKPIQRACRQDGKLYYTDVDNCLWCYNTADDGMVMLSDLRLLGEMGHTTSAISALGEEIYVGFFGGALGRIPAQGGTCELIGSDYRIFCLLPDRNQDILWVGTDGYGVYMYCQKDNLFTTILMDELPQKVLKPVRAMYADPRGDLWIGTKGDGVIRIRDYAQYTGGGLPAERVTRFDRSSGLAGSEVFAFSPSPCGERIWLGNSGPGLSYYSYKTDRIRTLARKPGSQDIRSIHRICALNDSTLYLASDTEGLIELKINPGEVPEIRSQISFRFRMGHRDCNEFYAMLPESDSTLLLAMRGGYGLIRFNLHTKGYDFVDMHRLQSRALGDLLSLCQAESGLYCGASSGLIHISKQGDIRQFDSRSGILNDMVHGVLEDAHGCIWLSTNKGLTQYNPRHDYFYNYSAPDLKVSEFCDDAYWKCPRTNRLFFGGVNGVVWIDPASEPTAVYKPQLRFLDLELSDGTLLPLADAAAAQKAVRVPPLTGTFSVSFVAVDYLHGENYEYAYHLEGAEGGWIELQKNNRATFINLPPGGYELQVRYKSNVMDQNNPIYRLSIIVLPPWYRTTAALTGYLLLVMGAIWLLTRTVRRHYRRKERRVVFQLEEEQREKLSEARLNFFVNISHELCTPLTLINGMNERIAQLGEKNPELRKFTDVMDENVRGLNDLVQEILDFRKIEEAGFGRVHIQCVDVAEMLSAQVRSFSDEAQHSGIELQMESAPGLRWNTDAAFLKKIVTNLVSNAMKYTPRDGQIRVSATSEERTDGLTLRVYNTGRGIDPAQLGTVFDRYRILDTMDHNAYSGTASRNGLGLFICRGLVQALGGEISVQSQVEHFTQFVVHLPPQEIAAATDAAGGTLSRTQQPPGTHGKRPTILVADDNKDIIWLIESSLGERFRVVACTTVDQALARLSDLTPDLIITDIVMPDRSGLELIAAVRSDKYLRGIPIVVISGRATENEQIEGLGEGADAYLTKPFSVPVLTATVARLLENRRTLKEYFNTPESVYTLVEGQKMHQNDKVFMDEVLAIVQEYIESENLRMELIAERVGLTGRNFYRKFKKITGRTPSDFIKDYRFEYAARLLTTTELTVQEIMYKVGISNKSYFYREFQKKYGFKPKEFRLKG